MIKYQVSSKFVHWEPSCSIRTGEQTDMMKLVVAFRNFANTPDNWIGSGGIFPPFYPLKATIHVTLGVLKMFALAYHYMKLTSTYYQYFCVEIKRPN